MKKIGSVFSILVLSLAATAQQVPNAGFEDWSAEPFNKKYPQPASWHASNVEQFGLKFNFAHQEAGHTGKYAMMVQDQEVGAAGIKETSPGYFSLGHPWVYIENLFKVKYASAGTYGGIEWKYCPDTMSVWIKRTGENVMKEDFYLLYYAWRGNARGDEYKNKIETCTRVTHINEESDIRLALDGNECGTTEKVPQIAEGMWRERREYSRWTNIRVPIYYMSNETPTMMNIIFSASNYPNYRANTGLYAGNSLYVDDIQFIYSDKIQTIKIDGKVWKEFDGNTTKVQEYRLPASATAAPQRIECFRGAGSLTNAHGETARFQGRKLSSNEVTITPGVINGKPMTISVKSGDGKTTRTYLIRLTK